MNPVLMDVLPFVRQGFCCSQLLMLLILQGLCHGIGHSEGDCGLLPGGACVLALLCGKGADEEVPHQMLNPLLNEYATWFYERTAQYGGYTCPQVAAGLGARKGEDGVPDPVACGELLADCWVKIGELVESYGLDITATVAE